MIISLQGELKELKTSIEKHKPQTDSFSYEEVVQEVFDRNQRMCNLVIFGVQEDQSLRTARERQTFDSNKVKRILEVLSYEGESNSVKPIRLGKFDATKRYPRPLKIKLDDENTVHRLIKKAGDLKNHADVSSVNIAQDRTPRQISFYRQLKTELNNRIANGEVGLKIKNIRGIPTIVQTN
nr:unnamed protein product [Callosobruchus analis]